MSRKNQYISILNKIRYKPYIIETLFPYLLNRPSILDSIISNDNILKKKLNSLFSNVKRKSNKLGQEFTMSLETYSLIREMLNSLEKLFQEIKTKPITYNFLRNDLNYSYINYLKSQLKILFFNFIYRCLDDIEMTKGLIKDYYSTLEYSILSYIPSDYEYLNMIEIMNENSMTKNKINQKIKLLLIIDENNFYNSKNKIISYPNITEIELLFNKENITKDNLFFKFNLFLSKIEYLENINKIIFHNKVYENNLTENKNKIIKEYYQCIISFLLDQIYKEENSELKGQILLLKNVKEINVEDITFLYIYEKMKLYYCINDIFPSISRKKIKIINNKNNELLNANININYYLTNKIFIINNKEEKIKLKELLLFIEFHLKSNTNIEYLMIINHNKLINDEVNELKDIDLLKLKEFFFIDNYSESNIDNNQKFIKLLNLPKCNYYEYEGYDKDNKLIIYRKGETQIQSFDLIDLFKYNKKLIHMKLIKEKIQINYNEERTNLEILNIGKEKSVINKIINARYNLVINHFSQFIFNQNQLYELTINYFDIQFKEIQNNNIKTLNINYIEDSIIGKFVFMYEKNVNLAKIFPNLVNLNIGGNSRNVMNLFCHILSSDLKNVNIIIDKNKTNYYIKAKKKFNKYAINYNIKYLENLNEKNKVKKDLKNGNKKEDFYDEIEEEEEEEEEDDDDAFLTYDDIANSDINLINFKKK